MIALMQRVKSASVTVDEKMIASIDQGLLVLLGVEKADDRTVAERLADKILKYRVFADDQGKMNLSVLDIGDSVLMVPQFTLVADTRKGLRPSFSSGAPAAQGKALFDAVVDIMQRKVPGVAKGQFGADMSVHLINDGPVTFWLES